MLFSAVWQPARQPLLVVGQNFTKFGNPFGNPFDNLFGNPFGNLGKDGFFRSR